MVIVFSSPLFLSRGMTTDSMRAPNSTFNVLLNLALLFHTGAENKRHMTLEVTVRFVFLMRRHFLSGGESEGPFCVNWKGQLSPRPKNTHCRRAPFIESLYPETYMSCWRERAATSAPLQLYLWIRCLMSLSLRGKFGFIISAHCVIS